MSKEPSPKTLRFYWWLPWIEVQLRLTTEALQSISLGISNFTLSVKNYNKNMLQNNKRFGNTLTSIIIINNSIGDTTQREKINIKPHLSLKICIQSNNKRWTNTLFTTNLNASHMSHYYIIIKFHSHDTWINVENLKENSQEFDHLFCYHHEIDLSFIINKQFLFSLVSLFFKWHNLT